jgi:hypothetical protein
MMEVVVRASETSVDNHFTRQYIPEDNSEHHTRRRENLKSHKNQIYERILSGNAYFSHKTHYSRLLDDDDDDDVDGVRLCL